MSTDYDVIVIGGGAPGRHAAGALAAGGRHVALVEREPDGNHGGDGVALLPGTGRLAGPCAVEVDGVRYRTDDIVLATGAEPIVPPVRGLRELEGVWRGREAVAAAPAARRLLVLGAGRTGVELAQAARRRGAEVALIARSGRVLRREAAALGAALAEVLRCDGIELELGARVRAARHDGDEYRLELDDGRELRGDRLLVAAGRRPRVGDIGLVSLHMVPDARGIAVDGRLRAGLRLWACGAVTGLAHAGTYQAGVVAANILGERREAHLEAVLRIARTDPPAVAVGAVEDRFSGTARVPDGHLTVLGDGERVSGAHALGSPAGAWLRQLAPAVATGAPLPYVRPSCEACVAALDALRGEIATAAAS